jgi:predicted glycoside hydrolase/deacetylase ChbG (UPF0249 family)
VSRLPFQSLEENKSFLGVSMRHLIINADDFGRFVGISRGILDTHLRGLVTSTTVMVTCEDVLSSVEMAMQEAPELRMGLHINLTYGKPLSTPNRVPTLVDEAGLFRTPIEPSSVFLGWRTDDLWQEMNAQIERFIWLTGKLPTHLDSHYHAAFLFPIALSVMLDLAVQYGLPVRRPPSLVPVAKAVATLLHVFPKTAYEDAGKIIRDLKNVLVEYPSVVFPDKLELGFSRPHISLEKMKAILRDLPHGITELMCHPGYVDAVDTNPYRIEREKEVEVLSSVDVREVLVKQDIRLISFDKLLHLRG